MAIFYRLEQNKNTSNTTTNGKYYARAVSMSETVTEHLAMRISRESGMSIGVVTAVLKQLPIAMRQELQDGHTVVLDGIGRFRLAIESEGVVNPSEFDLRKHIKNVRCKFIAEGRHVIGGGKLVKGLCEGVKIKSAPEYNIEDEGE
jgi:predicted histone-like DNA-binding protein